MTIRADATALPIADGCAEVVVAGEIFEHVEDPLAVVAEAARVLAPGGTVIIDSIAATRSAARSGPVRRSA
jgi:2-polyprenyl-6-hydroxyphenyl methylase/3-demethylubiquinone-9 3-methyltransferase